MRLTSTMVDLEGGSASLGLFGDLDEAEGAVLRPPHVQVTVPLEAAGDAADIRRRAIAAAIAALDEARASLAAEA